jgi:hypothetical protein
MVCFSQDESTTGPNGKAREEARAAVTKKLTSFAQGSSEATSLISWFQSLTLATLTFDGGRSTISRIHESDVETAAMLLVTCEADRTREAMRDLFSIQLVGAISFASQSGKTVPVPISLMRSDKVFGEKVQCLAQLQLIFDAKAQTEKNDQDHSTVYAEEFAEREMKRVAGSAYDDAFNKLEKRMEEDRKKAKRAEGDYEFLRAYLDVLGPINKKFGVRSGDPDERILLSHLFLEICFKGVDARNADKENRVSIKHQLIRSYYSAK